MNGYGIKYLRWPVGLFWLASNYGRPTKRVLGAFFALSLLFALLYWVLEVSGYGVVAELGSVPATERGFTRWIHLLVRSSYFSIVTMTTLGFGDMSANPDSALWHLGYLLIIFHVLLGYTLLAALITRLAVLFTSSGPEGKMEETKTDWQHFLQMLMGKSS